MNQIKAKLKTVNISGILLAFALTVALWNHFSAGNESVDLVQFQKTERTAFLQTLESGKELNASVDLQSAKVWFDSQFENLNGADLDQAKFSGERLASRYLREETKDVLMANMVFAASFAGK